MNFATLHIWRRSNSIGINFKNATFSFSGTFLNAVICYWCKVPGPAHSRSPAYGTVLQNTERVNVGPRCRSAVGVPDLGRQVSCRNASYR